jgi:hypothetical protein
MTDELISKSALFFFLLTLDDKLATEATTKTIENVRSRLHRRAGASVSENPDLETLVRCCLEYWQIARYRFRKEQIQLVNSRALRWPDHIDLNPWKEFQKRAPEAELIAVTWVHVLGIPEALLARCLNVSEGTIRYRVGNALALLGQLNRPIMSSIQFS